MPCMWYDVVFSELLLSNRVGRRRCRGLYCTYVLLWLWSGNFSQVSGCVSLTYARGKQISPFPWKVLHSSPATIYSQEVNSHSLAHRLVSVDTPQPSQARANSHSGSLKVHGKPIDQDTVFCVFFSEYGIVRCCS